MTETIYSEVKSISFRAVLSLFLSLWLSACAISSGQWFDSERHRRQNFFERFFLQVEKKEVPADGVVTVGKGDTYYSIAQSYNVSMTALIEENKEVSPYNLIVGQKLRLPKPRTYIVQRGDTLYGIARRYNVQVSDLVRQNQLSSPYTLSVGQEIDLPRGSAPAQVVASNSGAQRTVRRPSAVRDTPPARAGRFLRPVEGPVLSSYGPKKGGLHNDGINIAAPGGTDVKAAENGVVVYAGNELRGYGNLILIRHDDGWVTAYAHNAQFKVKPGDKVKQGQAIATVGQTGNVDKPQLHFEIRKGAKAVDPTKLM